MYIDNTYPQTRPLIYTTERIDKFISAIQQGKTHSYGMTDTYLAKALKQYKEYVVDKDIAIIGSDKPWYEAFTLAYGGRPTTIEYNKIVTSDPRHQIMTVAEYK